jgi:uncharacterized glyoxalase superfamily protein PhnB
MFSQHSYPIICANDLSQTVNFYEDFFDFVVALEIPGYAVMKREGFKDAHIAIIDKDHKEIPEAYRRPVQGMILSMPVPDVRASYMAAYWEGLDIVSEPVETCWGRLHFMVEDPNGILIDVSQNVPAQGFVKQDGSEERVFLTDCV